MDHEFFDNISKEQMVWYNAMLLKDDEESFERQRDFVEYLASFWNSEAVQKIKKAREDSEYHAFASDREFSEQLMDKSFLDNKYVEAIQAINRDKDTNRPGKGNSRDSIENLRRQKTKLPTDLASLINEV